jgi:stage III sporulation protein AC
MDTDILFKIAGVGIISAIASIVLRRMDKEEVAHLVTLAGVIIVLWMVVQKLTDLLRAIRVMFGP